MKLLHFAADGKQTGSVPVTGYDNFCGATRPFVFSRRARALITFEADFLRAGPGPRPVAMWAVDVQSGAVKTWVLDGVRGLPTGYCEAAGDQSLLLGTTDRTSARTETKGAGNPTLRVYKVSPTLATAQLLGAWEEAGDAYAAHFYSCSSDGHTAHRAGFRDVTHGAGPGVGSLALPGAEHGIAPDGRHGESTAVEAARSHWTPLDCDVGALVSVQAAAGGAVLGLAQRPRGGLDVVRWEALGPAPQAGAGADACPEVLASLGRATTAPALPLVGRCGYVVDQVINGTLYTALVGIAGALPLVDKWAFAVHDLAAGTTHVAALAPAAWLAITSMSGMACGL